MATIRGYNVIVSNTTARIKVNDKSKTSYPQLPTIAEINEVIGESVSKIELISCFSGCTSLTTAPAIPRGVTSMWACFNGCTSLTTAPTIPRGVTRVGYCFAGCTALTTAPTIPSGVTDMESCFAGCTSLTTARTIPNGVTDMNSCFDGCTSLTTAPTIPNSVTDLSSCFASCTALTTAPTIPNSVIDMSYCFAYCISLTTAPTIPNSVTDMQSCFGNCTSLTTAPAIPSRVTNISYCFDGCTSLTTAPTIPNSVANIASCFNGCTALTGKIVINANPSIYTKCMKDTQQEIVLTGSSAQLQNIASTATNNNVYVWSLSINVSAERQEDDFSKANVSVIINRFRNNNESVSLTFTINSVESTPVQVIMDTATKTYTGVLSITPSSIVELSVIAEDNYGKSAPKSITIPIPFYTIDFQAGGKEVAVGSPANDDVSNRPYGLFKCGMDLVVTRLVGEIKMWAGDTVPYGWLLCDGSEVSKTEYPYLYASIGDLWGVPSSSSNFKLPNLAGNVPVGYNSADTDFDTVGKTGGEKTHKLTIAEMPAHTHSRNYYSADWCANGGKSGYHGNDAGTARTTGSRGGDGAHNNLQPYAVVKYIICAF